MGGSFWEEPLLYFFMAGENSMRARLECVFITAVPITKLFACGGGLMLKVCVFITEEACVFITAGPSTKLFAWGDLGGHVLPVD